MKTATITFITAVIICLTSCAVKNADETGMFFYKMLINNDIETAVSLIDKESLKHTPLEVWKEGLVQKHKRMGALLSYQRTKYYTDTIDNTTRVSICYEVKYSEGVMNEQLQFIYRDGKYYITFYEFTEATE